jgi:hypothetical protein
MIVVKSNFLKIGNTILFLDYDYSRTGLFGYLFFENVDFYNADFPKMEFIFPIFKKLDEAGFLFSKNGLKKILYFHKKDFDEI